MKTKEIMNFYLPLYGMTVLTGIAPFLVAPFVARALSIEEFGIYNLAHSTAYFLLPLITLGMQTGARVSLSNIDGSEFKEHYSRVLSSSLSLTFIIAIVIYFILTFFNEELYGSVFNSSDLLAIVGLSVCVAIISFLYVFYEIKNWFLTKGFLMLVSTSIVYSGIYLYIDYGPMVRIYIQIIVFPLIILFCLYAFKIKFLIPTKKILKKVLNIGLPLTGISLLELLVLNIAPIIILKYFSAYDLGIYTAYFYFYTLVAFGAKPLSPVLEMFYYQKNDQYKKILMLILLVLGVVLLVLVLFHKNISDIIFGDDFINQSYLMIFFFILGISKVIVDFSKVRLVAASKQYSAVKRNTLVYILGIISMFIILPLYQNLIHIIWIMIGINLSNILSNFLILKKIYEAKN